ncbi:MAG: hypothetical protein K6E59_05695 [Bacilli bacterium]|nr:hypothetical protein [Bacilli bacterium]
MDPSIVSHLRKFQNGVAHRGLHDLTRPENSKAAFIAAIEANQPFECDIHRCKNGGLVVCHDSNLLRMCGKEGTIEELTLEEVKENYRLPDGSRLLTLQELFALNDKNVPMVLELKSYGGNEHEIVEEALPIIHALPNLDDCLLISFWDEILRHARKLGAKLPLGYLVGTEAVKHASPELLREFDFLDVEVHYSLLPRFRKYRKEGGALLCWTVKGRLTAWIGKWRCHALTWEEVDSAKPKLKLNRYIQKRFDPR